MDNSKDYKDYGFVEGVPFKGNTPCSCGETKEYLKEALQEIMESSELDTNRIACHINCAKKQIIDEIHVHAIKPCAIGNLATKDDVRKAVDNINAHTDERFDEADFEGHFSDLNEQVRALYGKI